MPDTSERAPRSATSVNVGRLEDLEDLRDGSFLHVRAGGREIGIVRWGDEVFAVRNVCPHVAGPVCTSVRLHLRAAAPELIPVADPDRPVVICAWHRWEYDLRTGESVCNPKLRVKTYPVDVRADGSIWITV